MREAVVRCLAALLVAALVAGRVATHRLAAQSPAQGIRHVVARYYTAMSRFDLKLLATTVDPTNRGLERLQRQEAFDWFEEFSGSRVRSRVERIGRMPHGFYRATVHVSVVLHNGDFGEELQSMLFRRVHGEWKLSEPSPGDLGPLRSRAGRGVTLEYYEWDSRQAGRVLKIAERSYARVTRLTGVRLRKNVRVRLLPAYAVSPGHVEDGSVGYYLSRMPNTVFVRSPGSLGFGGYDPSISPYDELGQSITHELTHLVSDRKVGIEGLPDWMTEGFAEWVAGSERPYEVRQALEQHRFLDVRLLDQFSGGASELDLDYGGSYELVDYVIHLKGTGGYWTLLRDYKRTHDLDSALRRSLGMGMYEFQERWQRWLRAKYRLPDTSGYLAPPVPSEQAAA